MTDEPEEDEDLDEEDMACHCCGFENPVGGLHEISENKQARDPGPFQACFLCYSTLTGNRMHYPGQDDEVILKTICYVGNQLRRDIAERTLPIGAP